MVAADVVVSLKSDIASQYEIVELISTTIMPRVAVVVDDSLCFGII